MNYNLALKKVIIPHIVDNIIKKVDEKAVSWKLNVDSYTVKESTDSFDYFKNEGKSCLMELTINYTVSSRDDKSIKPITDSMSLYIPQMIKSSFVIDGKARTHESYFEKGNDLNISEHYISFGNITYRDFTGDLNIYVRGVGSQVIKLEDLGDYSKLEHAEFEGTEKLTPQQRKKIKIIYGINPPKRLTKELILRMMTMYVPSMRDHIVTKQLITVDRALLYHMEKITFKAVRNLSAQFYKNGILYSTSLQSSIYNFFKGRSESVNPVHFPDNINELTFMIASKKVIMETGLDDKKKLHVSKTRYNPTFFDVVDPATSPDGPNINRKNELGNNISLNTNGDIMIKVYDKNFKEVDIELLDYMLSKVLHYQDVDYKKKKTFSSPHKVKYRGEIIDESPTFDYIDMDPDERLSTTSRLIPMYNSCDSVRVSMG